MDLSLWLSQQPQKNQQQATGSTLSPQAAADSLQDERRAATSRSGSASASAGQQDVLRCSQHAVEVCMIQLEHTCIRADATACLLYLIVLDMLSPNSVPVIACTNSPEAAHASLLLAGGVKRTGRVQCIYISSASRLTLMHTAGCEGPCLAASSVAACPDAT